MGLCFNWSAIENSISNVKFSAFRIRVVEVEGSWAAVDSVDLGRQKMTEKQRGWRPWRVGDPPHVSPMKASKPSPACPSSAWLDAAAETAPPPPPTSAQSY